MRQSGLFGGILVKCQRMLCGKCTKRYEHHVCIYIYIYISLVRLNHMGIDCDVVDSLADMTIYCVDCFEKA